MSPVSDQTAQPEDKQPLDLPPMIEPEPAATPAPSGRAARRAVVAEDEALIRLDVVETLRTPGSTSSARPATARRR